MKASIKKILIMALVLGLNWTGVFAVGKAFAYYNDKEEPTDSGFIAGSLDFTLNDNGFSPIESSVSLGVGDLTKKNIDIINELGSNPYQYYASSTNFTGDIAFCDDIGVSLSFDNGLEFGDFTSLLDINTIATTSDDSLVYEFGYGVWNFQNKVCEFDIDYNAWQLRHDYSEYENGGFSDTESVHNKISSWGLRLNKVYYDVESDRGVEGENEWVEIYNQTNVPLDISGWEICDNKSCDVIPNTPDIPAFGYAVITASTTTWGFWYVPLDIKKIVLDDNKIGNGLGNVADMLVLKRPDGVIIDQMNWGDLDEGWDNYNTGVWGVGATDVSEGNTLARLPSGHDTDNASDWTELAPPVVDLIYPDENFVSNGEKDWFWNETYDLEWIAENNNGDDADLNVDIYYIKDINHDGEISNGDIQYPVALNVSNNGIYSWTVPMGFVGYIWIKIVATGPENPMLNDVALSGGIYDPEPVFLDNTPDTMMLGFLNKEGEGESIDGDEMPKISEEAILKADLEEKIADEEVVEGGDEFLEYLLIEETPVVEEDLVEVEEAVNETVDEEVVLEDEIILTEEINDVTSEDTVTEVVEEVAVEESADVIDGVPTDDVDTEEAVVTEESVIEEDEVVIDEPSVVDVSSDGETQSDDGSNDVVVEEEVPVVVEEVLVDEIIEE